MIVLTVSVVALQLLYVLVKFYYHSALIILMTYFQLMVVHGFEITDLDRTLWTYVHMFV